MSDLIQLRQLFGEYASGTIEEAAFQRLEAALRVDADLRREFLEYLNLDSALGDLAALSKAESEELDAEQVTLAGHEDIACEVTTHIDAVQTRSHRPVLLTVLATAAAILLCVVWFEMNTDRVELPFAASVQVLSVDEARLSGVQNSIQVGNQLDLSRITLTAGTIRLRLVSGVELDLFAPVEAAFESPSRIRLDRGRLNADVGESGHGFTVITNAGEIVDLGTRFGVDVDAIADGGEAKVAVFEGEVAIHSKVEDDSIETPLKVVEGEGVRLRNGKPPKRLSTVNVSGQQLRLSASGSSSVVNEVTDNADATDFRRYYGVVAGGMGDGTIAYTTMRSKPRRDVVWRSMPGEAFPVEMVGADVVCPFHTDRLEKALTISLHLSQPATVFVMHDARRPPPRWLRTTFQETGQMIRSGPWRSISPVTSGIAPDAEGDIYVGYSIWKQDISDGLVELGPPHAQKDRGFKAMYGIAVRPLHQSVLDSK